MPLPKFEVVGGVIDGVNLVFMVSSSYRAGTLAVFLNGQLKRADYADGWTEVSPSSGSFSLKQAPEVLDVVEAFFIDTSPVLPGEVLYAMTGRIDDVSTISGKLLVREAIRGTVEAPASLFGTVFWKEDYTGLVEPVSDIIGRLEVVV